MGAGSTRLHPAVDVVVVGAGAAGLYAALVAAEAGASVRLLSSSPLAQSASYWAQGGLAAALGPDDSPRLHADDTIRAGRGATRTSAVEVLVTEAPDRVRELERRGVPFDRAGAELALGLEGGHTARRIVHSGGSATGRSITDALSTAAVHHERLEIHEQSSARRLWVHEGRCVGVVADTGATPASATVLATGGAAALWRRTTNPRGAVGSGLVLAAEAGATLADLELLQFHPTALATGDELDGFLVTEAVRGEGARLLNRAGERFVDELAPRDVVARAIHDEIVRSSGAPVLLDMRELPSDAFPNVVAVLARAGLDHKRDLIPVAPAAHYMIGGVLVNTNGRSTLPGLLAIGECCCTGVHGANRLASNSLSECFVFGRRAALAAAGEAPLGREPAGAPEALPTPAPSEETRTALWERAGLVRERAGLEMLSGDRHPLARLIAQSALAREESRGAHQRSDFPHESEALERTHGLVEQHEAIRLERWA